MWCMPLPDWGFYGHRLALYRSTEPHAGFDILHFWAARMEKGGVFTSNVDRQFQKAANLDSCIAERYAGLTRKHSCVLGLQLD
ncbi:hypothetical protein PPGU19_085620 (plasmid) [Paraburkholderia sp. PGU19]|nr:hypothetical protein PPGU19_085620 [Paraburkholderia sp. PGU19]